MPSPELLEQHRQEIADIVAVAQAELIESWDSMPLDNIAAAKQALTATMTDLVETFGPMAAGAGADWYSAVRAEVVAGGYTPRLSVALSAEQIASNAGWSVGPLLGTADEQTALTRASGALQKLVVASDRQTVIGNTNVDRKAQRWYRGASASCCSLCALLASRGAAYRSQSSADFKTHDHCRCFAAPQFQGESPRLPDYYDQFAADYDAAVAAVDQLGERRTSKAILREMRKATGRK